MRTILATAAVAATLGGVSIADGENQSKGGVAVKPPPVYVGAAGTYVRAAQGSYCYAIKRSGICVDYFYPLEIKSRLAVAGGERLIIDAGKRVERLNGYLIRVEGEGFDYVTNLPRGLKVSTRHGRFWKLRLPADLEGANALDLDLDFGRGSSTVWAGLAPTDSGQP